MKALVREQFEAPMVREFEEFPSPPNGPTGAKEVEPLAAALRHWRLIVAFALGGGLAAYLLCQMFTPLFAARASVMIDPREPKRPMVSTDPTSALPPSEETVRKNEIALIRSRKLAEVVVSELELAHDPEFNLALHPGGVLRDAFHGAKREAVRWFSATIGLAPEPAELADQRSGDSMLDGAVDIFLDKLGTTSTEASRVIDIRFWSVSAERAASVANTVAERYISEKIRQDLAQAQAESQTLESEIAAVNMKVREGERASERMRNEYGIVPAAGLKIVADQVVELNKQFAVATGERAAAAARLSELNNALASKRVDSVASVLGSPLIQKLQESATMIAAKMSEMSATHGPSHPSMIGARAELADFRAQINREIAKIATSYASDVALAQAKERALREMLDRARTEMAKATVSEVDVRAFEREAEANKSLMAQLVTRLADIRAQINSKGPEARIISRATVPRSPSFPPTKAITAAALLVFATGGAILSVLLERRDESIRSTAQLRQVTTARVLGAVPALEGPGRAKRSPAARVLAERTSMFVEKLRGVWFQLDHSKTAQAKTLLVTSSVPDEGKSSIAASLARVLALGGRRIVLVDADLRHASVHRVLGLKKSPGLAELLEGQIALEDVLQRDSASGAYIIAAGSPVSSPGDILQSPNMRSLLEALSARFDAVILDSPPLLAVHDAGILARQVDMTVMVVRWGTTKETAVVAAMQRLHDLDVPVSGVILSMVDRKKYGRYGYPGGDILSDEMKKYYSS